MLSRIVCLGIMIGGIMAQELPPTDQTSFSFPSNGAGVELPFPSYLATLTGLSSWPDIWVTPPFTPNMKKLFNPSATAVKGDIMAPPNAVGMSLEALYP